MSDIAIKVENLSKIYRLGEIGTGTISRDMERWFKMKVLKQEDPFLKIGDTNDRANKGTSDIVYSLRDINFEINQGDTVGIIGRNGAGKSTLLKILSRVTTPTTGKINIKGRVASLLEVGTGFHPELTGRENIYLNGAILGMRKREIDRKLDEIIDFSGVERYIDTPVKRYSSGMYVRLAFAVAAHLESEILIVDEVLAVGDAEFQKKCLGKMGEVSKGEGRTVLFVSHNMASIRELCSTGILLNNGIVSSTSKGIEVIIQQYSTDQKNKKGSFDLKSKIEFEGGSIQSECKISNGRDIKYTFTNDENICVEFDYELQSTRHPLLRVVYTIFSENGPVIFSGAFGIGDLDIGNYKTELVIPKYLLNIGLYHISARVDIPNVNVVINELIFGSFNMSEIINHSYMVLAPNEPVGFIHLPIQHSTDKY